VPATTLTLPAASMQLLSGDHDFGGNGPAVTAWAKLEKWSVGHPGKFQDELRVRFGMRLDETEPDRTRSRGETTVLLYRATQGCYIDTSRLPGTFDSNGFLAQRPGLPDPHLLAAGDSSINPSFVSGYSIDVQHIGDDVGSYSRMAVSTKALDIFFTG
jgi:hypothetical protein